MLFQMPSDKLFYRALFEVLLKRYLSDYNDNSLYCLGKIKCSNFNDYVHNAIKKIGLELQVYIYLLQYLFIDNVLLIFFVE